MRRSMRKAIQIGIIALLTSCVLKIPSFAAESLDTRIDVVLRNATDTETLKTAGDSAQATVDAYLSRYLLSVLDDSTRKSSGDLIRKALEANKGVQDTYRKARNLLHLVILAEIDPSIGVTPETL